MLWNRNWSIPILRYFYCLFVCFVLLSPFTRVSTNSKLVIVWFEELFCWPNSIYIVSYQKLTTSVWKWNSGISFPHFTNFHLPWFLGQMTESQSHKSIAKNVLHISVGVDVGSVSVKVKDTYLMTDNQLVAVCDNNSKWSVLVWPITVTS